MFPNSVFGIKKELRGEKKRHNKRANLHRTRLFIMIKSYWLVLGSNLEHFALLAKLKAAKP